MGGAMHGRRNFRFFSVRVVESLGLVLLIHQLFHTLLLMLVSAETLARSQFSSSFEQLDSMFWFMGFCFSLNLLTTRCCLLFLYTYFRWQPLLLDGSTNTANVAREKSFRFFQRISID